MKKFIYFIGIYLFFASFSSAADLSQNCAAFKGNISKTVLYNENGKIRDHLEFIPGNMDISSLKTDFVFSQSKYHIILSPASRTIENDCSMSICIQVKRVKPSCPRTNEYVVNFGLNPKKIGGQSFNIDFELKALDNGLPDTDRSGFQFKEIVDGIIPMPWLSVPNSPSLSSSLLSLYKPGVRTTEVPITNFGSINYVFGEWESSSENTPGFELLPGTCRNAVLGPHASCTVVIRKIVEPPAGVIITEWWNKFKDADLKIRFQIEKQKDSGAAIAIYNLEW
jgi:hypothetical protein